MSTGRTIAALFSNTSHSVLEPWCSLEFSPSPGTLSPTSEQSPGQVLRRCTWGGPAELLSAHPSPYSGRQSLLACPGAQSLAVWWEANVALLGLLQPFTVTTPSPLSSFPRAAHLPGAHTFPHVCALSGWKSDQERVQCSVWA